MSFQVTEFKNVINFPFVWCRDVMTSCHDVTKLDSPISACRRARKLILFFVSIVFRSLSSKILIIFYLCDVVTSWRLVMTSQKLFNLSQVMNLLERWSCSGFHGFLVAYFRNVSVHVFVGWYHVIMSRHDVTSILIITLQHLLILVVESYRDYYTNSMLIWVVGIKQIIDTMFESCRQHVTTSRHDVTMWRHAIVLNWSNTSMPSIFTCQLTRFTYILFNCSILSS